MLNFFCSIIIPLLEDNVSYVQPNGTIELKCQHLQTLPNYTKDYVLSLPLTFEQGIIIENATWEHVQVVDRRVRINAISDVHEFQYQCWTHQVVQSKDDDGAVVMEIQRSKEEPQAQVLSTVGCNAI